MTARQATHTRSGVRKKRMPKGDHRRDMIAPKEWRIEDRTLLALVSAHGDDLLCARVGSRVLVVGDAETAGGNVTERRETRGGTLLTILLDSAPLVSHQDLRLKRASRP